MVITLVRATVQATMAILDWLLPAHAVVRHANPHAFLPIAALRSLAHG